jgi:hypothetical protein
LLLLPDQLFLRGDGSFFEGQSGIHFSGSESRFRERAGQLAILQTPQDGEQHRRREPRPKPSREQVFAYLHEVVDCVIVRVLFSQKRVDHFQQFGFFPSLEHDVGPFLSRHGLKLGPGVRGLDGVVQVALDG